MKKSLNYLKKGLLIILLLLLSIQTFSQEGLIKGKFPGIWQGDLEAGGKNLTLVLRVVSDENNNLKASLDSPDQGVTGIDVNTFLIRGDSLSFISEAIRGRYDGVWDQEAESFRGIWKQSGINLILNLKKTDKAVVLQRPQEPQPPYPYQVEEHTFMNTNGGFMLSGTLSLPPGQGPFPACILITGSGAQNRDSEILGHKPFLVLSDHLTRKGFAVLRYDDRGTGKSGGDFENATMMDFVSDAKAAFEFLRKDNRIISSKIGFLGHSEGGAIASVVATQNLATAFIVLLAGSAIPGEDLVLAQMELISRVSGIDENTIKANNKLNKALFNILKSTHDTADAAMKMTALLEKEIPEMEYFKPLDASARRTFINTQVKTLNSPWYRTMLVLDPGEYLNQVRCPVLALYGEKDLQVPPAQNIKALKKALVKAGNADYQVMELPGLNHLFQKAKTGSPDEYGKIEETFSQKVLDIVAAWMSLKTR